MSEQRRLSVLHAIVEDYVATSEPVGSKALLDRHGLGVSAATIRNDMALLEEAGLVCAPHTSAGRIPTDAGYRLFVDHLTKIQPLRAAEKNAIARFLAESVDLDDVVDRTARLLASLTDQVAVMQYPSLKRSRIRHVEVLGLEADRVMVVLIFSTGRIEQRIIPVQERADTLSATTFLAALRTAINTAVAGRKISEALTALDEIIETVSAENKQDAGRIIAAVSSVISTEREERLVLAGTANLVRAGTDFPQSISPVLDALEEQVVLLRLVSHMRADSVSSKHDRGVAVRIGEENPHAGLRDASVITSLYGEGDMAGLGVIGPTRMDYPGTMATVRAVAKYVTQLLQE